MGRPRTSVFVPTGVVQGFRNVGQGVLRVEGLIAATELTARLIEEPQTGS